VRWQWFAYLYKHAQCSYRPFHRPLFAFSYSVATFITYIYKGWNGWLDWLLLYAHIHRNILGAVGHIILTPANQLMAMGLKKGHCPIQVRTSNLSITGPGAYQLL
jgi:hypothetical protein